MNSCAPIAFAAASISSRLALGFPKVEIDPRGYRSGRLNEGVVTLPVISG